MGSEKEIFETAQSFTVQEAAIETGLSVHTLRYYERVGLLDPPKRVESSGHRNYSEDDIRRVAFLKRLRTTGMTIREMQSFIALYRQGNSTLKERERLLEEQRCHVLNRIADLKETLTVIEYKITSYRQLGAEQNWQDKGVYEK